ncbi:hypothetical protein IAU59_002374 [Kwoniella sp. CBS 9459]
MRTPTRSSSRAQSNAGSATRSRSGMSMSVDRPNTNTTAANASASAFAKYPVSPSPVQQHAKSGTSRAVFNDIPIDPALLFEDQAEGGAETDMDDMEDAEGELVDDELDLTHHDKIDVNHQSHPVLDPSPRSQHQPTTSSSSIRPYPALPTKAPRFRSHPQSPVVNSQTKTPLSRIRNGPVESSSSQTPQSALKRKGSQNKRSRTSTPQTNGRHHLHQAMSAPSSSSIRVGSTTKLNGKGKGKDTTSLLPLTPAPTGVKRQQNKSKVAGVEIIYRDEICGFCGGTDDYNAGGQPEYMVSCAKCGRSGHRTCLNMVTPRLFKKVMTYDWQCIECKSCEHCQVKGDDSRLMFCDSCDRGWHSYCLNPPLALPPAGAWHCPKCRPVGSSKLKIPLPSTSHSEPVIPNASSRKGKEKAIPMEEQIQVTPTARIKKSGSARAASTLSVDDGVFEEHSSRIKVKIPRKGKDKDKDRDKGDDHRLRGKGDPRGRGRGRSSLGVKDDENEDGPPMIVRLRVPSGPNKNATEEESEEEKIPYGGIITGDDADTTRTTITDKDKEAFEKSRKAAEIKLGGPPPLSSDLPGLPMSNAGSPAPSPSPGVFGTQTPGKATPSHHNSQNSTSRGLRDRLLHNSVSDSALGFPFPATPPQATHHHHHHHHHHPQTPGQPGSLAHRPEKIKIIRFGPYEIDTWYSAPYPEEYAYVPEGKLWLCEFCLKYMKSGFVANRHRLKCKVRHPPGDEIYREGAVSVFEVDGRKNKIYCQNLCLLAKMFLDHKTLYYDVEPFLFYVMTEVDDLGARFVGYFSKEKRSMDNNVSCIMTLPVRQRKGWGNLLIDFSYLLSKKEGRVGSPEKPLSGLGAVTYKGYWRLSVFRYLLDHPDNVTMNDISLGTSVTLEDIYSVLSDENMINVLDSPPRETPSRFRGGRGRGRGRGGGRSSVNRRKASSVSPEDEEVKLPAKYTLVVDREYVQAVISKHDSKGYLKLRPERLKYHPFLVTRNPTLTSDERVEATLEAAGLSTDVSDGVTMAVVEQKKEEDEAAVIHGEDKATLELVASLSASPARSLRRGRKRPSEDIESPSRSVRSRMRSSVNGSNSYASQPNGIGNEGSVSPTKPSSHRMTRTNTGSPLSRRSMRGHQSLPVDLTSVSVSPEKPKSLRGQANGSTSSPRLATSDDSPANGSTSAQHRVSGGISAARRKRILSSDPPDEAVTAPHEDEEEEEVEEIEDFEMPDSKVPAKAPMAFSGSEAKDPNGDLSTKTSKQDNSQSAEVEGDGEITSTSQVNGAVQDEAPRTLLNGDSTEGHEKRESMGPAEGAREGMDVDADADMDAEGEDVDAEGEDIDAEGEDDDEYII